MINGATTNNQNNAPAPNAPTFDVLAFNQSLIQRYGNLFTALKNLITFEDTNSIKSLLAQNIVNVNEENGVLLQLAANTRLMGLAILDLILNVPNIIISAQNRALCRTVIYNTYDSSDHPLPVALVDSAIKNRVGVVKFLMSSNEVSANVTALFHTPLSAAVEFNHLETVQFLLSLPEIVPSLQYANLLHVDDNPSAALIAQMLIEHGADVSAKRGNGLTPLELVLTNVRNKLVTLGSAPLTEENIKFIQNNKTLIGCLIEYGADLNAGTSNPFQSDNSLKLAVEQLEKEGKNTTHIKEFHHWLHQFAAARTGRILYEIGQRIARTTQNHSLLSSDVKRIAAATTKSIVGQQYIEKGYHDERKKLRGNIKPDTSSDAQFMHSHSSNGFTPVFTKYLAVDSTVSNNNAASSSTNNNDNTDGKEPDSKKLKLSMQD